MMVALMSDTFWTTFFVGLPATIAAISTLIVATKNHKLSQKIETATNSMKDALVQATETEAMAKGVKEGIVQEQARRGEPGKAEVLIAMQAETAAKAIKDGIIRDQTIKQQD